MALWRSTLAKTGSLAKRDSIKDQVIWWSAGAETPQLLADKEVVMGSTYNGRPRPAQVLLGTEYVAGESHRM